jgi:hypothetical protein
MSPLHSSSPAQLRASAFPLPLFPHQRDREAGRTTAGGYYPQSRILNVAVFSGIFALLVALLIPTLYSHELTLLSTSRELVDHLRLARAKAVSQGAHFRVTLQPRSYVLEQLQDHDGNGIWEPDFGQSVWKVTLPPTIGIHGGAGLVIEFDARGLVTVASSPKVGRQVRVELRDSHTKKSELITILSSGKVQRS